jgi:hypothetical protein
MIAFIIENSREIILIVCAVGIIVSIYLAFKYADKPDSLGFKSFISTPVNEDEFDEFDEFE